MNKQHTLIKPLAGHFISWGDATTPHRYIKLATASGERLVKVAKNLRPYIQDCQPGLWLTFLSQERINPVTGETKIKVKQFLAPPRLDSLDNLSHQPTPIPKIPNVTPIQSSKIRVCQGSSCRRRGSEKICRSMQVYFDRHDLADRIEIETVKCLHQCKAGPHAIVTSPSGYILPGKTHYRQLQTSQVKTILAKHFPQAGSLKPIGSILIEKIGRYLDRHRISTPNTLS
jgi:(2Fe-2S) ferredoxin